MLIYLTGVTAGSLTVAIADPHVYLAGASGGVYALIAAHLANVVFNWREMEYPGLRLIGFIIIAGVDTGVAVYYRYTGQVCRYTYIYISISTYLLLSTVMRSVSTISIYTLYTEHQNTIPVSLQVSRHHSISFVPYNKRLEIY